MLSSTFVNLCALAADTRYDNDDAIFSITFAYINSVAHARYEPVNIKQADGVKTTYKRYMQSAETNYRMRLCLVDSSGKVLKMLNG